MGKQGILLMKISELINELNRQKKLHGDVLVAMSQEWTEEVDDVYFVEESPTGFSNPEQGNEYVANHVCLRNGSQDRIFFRKKS